MPIAARAAAATLALAAALAESAAQYDTGLPELEPGVTLRVYEIGRPMDRLYPLRPDQTPNADWKIEKIDLSSEQAWGGFGTLTDRFIAECLGYLVIEEPGTYRFNLTSDDGSRLFIDGAMVIDNDGVHAPQSRWGEVDLQPGFVPFRVRMFDDLGGSVLRLEWRTPGSDAFEVVPPEAYRVEKGITRVTSAGRKVIIDGKGHIRPGDGLPLEDVHPAWRVETVRPEGVEPKIGAMDFLPDGTLIYTTFEPVNNGILRESTNGTLWALPGVDGGTGRAQTQPVKIDDGFHDPSGVVCVGTDIYVSHRPGIELLKDRDGDGVYEHRETFAEPWVGNNYHHFSFGLQEHDGWIYGTLSTSIYFGVTIEDENVRGEVVGANGPNPANRGTVYRVHTDTREVEFIAGGLRTPNGLLVTADGDIFVTDNQGAWHPANRLNHIKPGRFYGHYNGLQASDTFPDGGVPSLHSDQTHTPPAVWLPQNEVSNSPTNMLPIDGGLFAGQYFMGELTAGGVRRVSLERVGGELQGAVYRFTQGLEAGVNRVLWGDDGCLYVGCTGAGGNWNWRGTQFGLQRLRPAPGSDGSAFEFHEISATHDGFEVRFTRDIDPAWLADPANYELTQWGYFNTPEYGGPKRREQRLSAALAIPHGPRTVKLTIPGLREGSVVHLRCDPRSAASERMWAGEAWYTLNRIPEPDRATANSDPHPSTGGVRTNTGPLPLASLDAFRSPSGAWLQAETAEALGDRIITAGRTGNPKPPHLGPPDPARPIVNGDSGRTTDLLSVFEHGDAHVSLEFMIPEGSNSGVYFQGRYEVQIRDTHGVEDPQHDDAGGVYQRWDPARGPGNEGFDGVGPRTNAAKPAGEWQWLTVLFRAPRFDPFGNKTANARFEHVSLNGVTIHRDVELTGPTRLGYDAEAPFGPLRLQGDHGPVAYRNILLSPMPFPSDEPSIPLPGARRLRDLDVLVFTKTAGFRHDSIPAGVRCFEELAAEYGFRVTHTEDAGVFTRPGLDRFDAAVFLNTTEDVLDEDQQAAFKAWYRAGRGFLGIHSAADTEHDWPWFGELVGARFRSHPPVQPARLIVTARNHPATMHLGDEWTRTDEWYDFDAPPTEDARRLLVLDEHTYRGGRMNHDHPIAWYREFDGGRTIYTGGGHTIESFSEPGFRRHLLGALLWAAGRAD